MTTIMGLLNQIANDEVVLPAIQRDFVWSDAQTERLLDSVCAATPSGSRCSGRRTTTCSIDRSSRSSATAH